MKGYTAIAGWVKDVPPAVLADLYMRAGASPARPPSKATIWRVITDGDAGVFDAMVGRWLMSQAAGRAAGEGEAAGLDDPAGLVPVRLDGKTIRSARDATGSQRHLLAALAGPAAQSPVVAAQAAAGRVRRSEARAGTASGAVCVPVACPIGRSDMRICLLQVHLLARLARLRRVRDTAQFPDHHAEPDDRDHQTSQADPVPCPHRHGLLRPDR